MPSQATSHSRSRPASAEAEGVLRTREIGGGPAAGWTARGDGAKARSIAESRETLRMLLATQRSRPVPSKDEARLRSQSAFTIDAQAATLLDADAGAWALWGLDPQGLHLPVSIDRAMPALQRLRELVSVRDP